MSESPKTSHEEEAGGGEGRAERAGYPEAGTSPAESRLGYPQAGYRAPMPPSSPWPTPSGYGDGYDPSGWRWNNAAPDAGGWVWDEASG
ncbi:MAG: hypothetical protein J2O47_03725, partial [Acidimicrobiaceae bacterium]|nr:hypothetical protein [Acidimicrobiaceae bacterium]